MRAKLRRLEWGAGGKRQVLPLGAEALDQHLPGGGLPLAVLHEIEGARAEWDDGVSAGFCLALLARLAATTNASMAWIARSSDLYGAGLSAFGLDPERLLLVRAGDDHEVLWAFEEALRCVGLAAVVGEVAGLGRTAGRRLQLAAEAHGVTGFLLRRYRTLPPRSEPPSTAFSRWRVAPAPSGQIILPSLLGLPRWQLELRRCRGATPARFLVEWDDASGCFALAAMLCDGSLDPQPQPIRSRQDHRLAG